MLVDAAIIFVLGNNAALGTPVVPDVNMKNAVSFDQDMDIIIALLIILRFKVIIRNI